MKTCVETNEDWLLCQYLIQSSESCVTGLISGSQSLTLGQKEGIIVLKAERSPLALKNNPENELLNLKEKKDLAYCAAEQRDRWLDSAQGHITSFKASSVRWKQAIP